MSLQVFTPYFLEANIVQTDFDTWTAFGKNEGDTIQVLYNAHKRESSTPNDVAAYVNDVLVEDWSTVLKDGDKLLFMRYED